VNSFEWLNNFISLQFTEHSLTREKCLLQKKSIIMFANFLHN